MNYLVIFSLLLIFICFFAKEHNIWNPGSLFCLYWLVICILASMKLYGLLDVSNEVYLILFYGAISYVLGCLLPIFKIYFVSKKQSDIRIINKKRFNMFFWIAFSFLFVFDMSAVILIYNGASIVQIRYVLNNQVLSTFFRVAICKFFLYPIVIGLVVVFLADIVQRKRINFDYFIKSFLLSVMEFLILGDRLVIYIWMVGIIVVYFTIKDQVIYKRALSNVRKLVLLLFLVAMVVMLLRGNSFNTMFKNVYNYFTGGLVYFSKQMPRINDTAGSTIFVSSYQGLFRPIMGVAETLFGFKWDLFETANDFLLNNQYIAVTINSQGGYFNYFTTCFGYFYQDLGYMGVVLHSFLWGCVSKYIYHYAKSAKDARSAGLYIFVVNSIALGMMNYMFSEVGIVWGIIVFVVCCKKAKNETLIRDKICD